MKIEYNSIGIVHTPFKDLNNIPNQPSQAVGTKGVVETSMDFPILFYYVIFIRFQNTI
jgi:tRNA (Thr-GGU) A37 N-methylase